MILTIVFSAQAFAAWPFGDKKETETKSSTPVTASSQKAQTSTVVRSSAASQDDSFFEEEDEETTAAPLLPQLPQVPKATVAGLPQIPKTNYSSELPGVPTGAIPVKSGEVAGVDPDIARIQKQIQEIMKINESLKTNFSGQAAEIQKISDQAKIHGEILKDLDSSKKLAEEANAEQYLNQEKLRLIQEETEKNQKYLEDLNKQKETAGSGTTKATSLIPAESSQNV